MPLEEIRTRAAGVLPMALRVGGAVAGVVLVGSLALLLLGFLERAAMVGSVGWAGVLIVLIMAGFAGWFVWSREHAAWARPVTEPSPVLRGGLLARSPAGKAIQPPPGLIRDGLQKVERRKRKVVIDDAIARGDVATARAELVKLEAAGEDPNYVAIARRRIKAVLSSGTRR